MKKMLIAVLVFISIAIIAYLLIPAKIDFWKVVLVKVNRVNATRFIAEQSKWKNWWPEGDIKQSREAKSDSIYTYQDNEYSVILNMLQGDSIIIKNNYVRVNSLLNIIPINSDSIVIQWKGESTATGNPIKRFKNYLKEKKLENNIEALLHSMKEFLENNEKLYGIKIAQIQVKDTILIASKYFSKAYPTTSEIYNLIGRVKNFIKTQGATETNHPMLHVIQDSSLFRTMVAIPVNKYIYGTNDFLLKKMVPGKILVTDVKGGISSAENAIKTIEHYMDDYHLKSPAIHFQSLVTDRSKETDTSKWITRIYYPVM
jgi:hypothetical protein